MNGRRTVGGTARALSEHREDIPHSTVERTEGVQCSTALAVPVSTSFHSTTTRTIRPT